MTSLPELSVVIRGGALNSWLESTVQSVLASHDVSLEVILVPVSYTHLTLPTILLV